MMLFLTITLLFSCQETSTNLPKTIPIMDQVNYELATLGGGCFWCTEAIFLELKGVIEVKSGYSGGKEKNPTYKEVAGGMTGHAESIQIKFDPNIISYETLLEVFFATHDPTTLNQQGNDKGKHYRSVIFFHNEVQEKIAQQAISHVATKFWDDPIVTELSPFTEFFIAEAYHQDYFNQNESQPYCSYVINPKVQKFRQKYASLLKD